MTRINDLNRKSSMNDTDVLPVWDSTNAATRSISFGNLRKAVPYMESVVYTPPNLILTQSDGNVFTVNISDSLDLVDPSVQDNDLVIWDANTNKFLPAGANKDATTGEITFDQAINVPAGTVNIGEVLSLSEGVADLVVVDRIKESMAFSVNSDFTDATGSAPPFYYDFGGPFVLNIQSDDTQVINLNPLTFQATGTVSAPNVRLFDRLTVRTNGTMTNVRIKVSDNATGLALRYVPSKSDYDSGVGYTLVPGDNTFFLSQRGTDGGGNFYLGYVPFLVEAGQVIDFEIRADAINLLGNSSNEPYLVAEAHDGPPIEIGGDVIGVASSIDNHIATFDGATGKRIKQGEDTLIRAQSATGNPQVVLQSSAGVSDVSLEANYLLGSAGVGSNLPFTLETFGSNDLTLKSAAGNINVDIDGSNQEFSVAGTAHADTDALVAFSTSGTNGGTTSFFIGDRDPNGNVTANGGALYIQDAGTSSALYIKKSDASNTDWVAIEEGNLDGPNSSIDNHIVTFDGTTGRLVKQGEDTLVRAESAAGNPQLRFENSGGTTDLVLDVNYLSSDSGLSSNLPFTLETFLANDLTLQTALGNVVLTTSQPANEVQISKTGQADTSAILNVGQTGTNSGNTNIYVGNRTPEGNVTADGGALYIRDDGVNSEIYIKRTDGSNTGWAELLHTGNGITGSGVANQFTYWTGTSTIDDADSFEWFVSGSQRATVLNSPSASGVVGHQLHISTGGIRSAWEWTETTQETDIIHAGTGNFRIAMDAGGSSGNLALENNGTGDITATCAGAANNINLTAGATSGNVNIATEGVTWNFDGDVFRTSASGASATQVFEFRNNLAATTTTLQNINATSTFDITSSYGIRIASASANGVQVVNSNVAGGFSVDNSGAPDTSPTISLDQGGTNGGVSSVYLGNRNPEGNISAGGGALYIQDNGTDSNLYLKVSDTGSADWVKFKSEGESQQTVAVINHPLSVASQSVSINTVQSTLPFTVNVLDTDTARLASNLLNNFIEVQQVRDTTNGDLYRVDFCATIRGPAGRLLNFTIDAIQNGSENNTHLECEVTLPAAGNETIVNLSGIVRGPNTTAGASGFRVLYRSTVAGGTLNIDQTSLSVERLS